MVVVRGKARELLDKAKESCLLAVDIYNKPKTSFRSGAYIIFMIIAWTSLFHAIFERKNIKYYYRQKDSIRYVKIDGEPKAWELGECIVEYLKDKDHTYEPIRANINFFIPLRNKIEHRFMPELDNTIFGECQSLLTNFEQILTEEFGEEHSINESLVYSLQFSKSYTKENKPSKDFLRIKEQIMEFRQELPPEIISDPKYRFQAILIQTSNPNKADYAIKFIHQDKLKPEQMQDLNLAVGITTEKLTPVSNLGNLRAKDAANEVQKELKRIHNPKVKFNTYHHNKCSIEYNARPESGSNDKRSTNKEWCAYDEVFEDYTYTQKWTKYLIKKLKSKDEFLRIFPHQQKEVLGLFTSTEVSKKVKRELNRIYGSKVKFGNPNHLKCILQYNIRPQKGGEPKDNTNGDYCIYDGGDRYLYTSEWVDFLIGELSDQSKFLSIFPNQADLITNR